MAKHLISMARDPVPEHLLNSDQVQAQRRATMLTKALQTTGEVVFVDKPAYFRRVNDPAVSHKQVPTVHEMVSQTYFANEAHYYGFVNADISFAPHFLPDVREARDKNFDILLFHRTDYNSLTQLGQVLLSDNPRESRLGKRASLGRSVDAILLADNVLDHFTKYFPDFVIGEPWWDTAFIFWAQHSPFSILSLRQNQIMHVVHPQNWSFKSVGARRAHKLFLELQKSWPKKI